MLYNLYRNKVKDVQSKLAMESNRVEEIASKRLTSVIERLKLHEPSLESFYETMSREANLKKDENLDASDFFSSNESNVSEKKIAALESVFSCKFDETIRSIVGKTGKTIFFKNGYRLLNFDEIKDCGKELSPVLIEKKLLPIIDCGDNEFIIYSLKNSRFSMFSTTDNTLFSKKDTILEYF